ncbi:MAG: hypothetical protein RH917_17795 [Lacipirellulaceae bacterium]
MPERCEPFDANRTVNELLDDPEVREHYRSLHMFFGEYGFAPLISFLRGYDIALLDYLPENSLFDGFLEWLHLRRGLDPCTPWEYYFIKKYGDDVETIPKFFETWDAFRAERDKNGLHAFLQEYREYDINRYGRITHSRERPYL